MSAKKLPTPVETKDFVENSLQGHISLSNQIAKMAEEIVALRRRVKVLEKALNKLSGLEEE